MTKILRDLGIPRRLTIPYAPQQQKTVVSGSGKVYYTSLWVTNMFLTESRPPLKALLIFPRLWRKTLFSQQENWKGGLRKGYVKAI